MFRKLILYFEHTFAIDITWNFLLYFAVYFSLGLIITFFYALLNKFSNDLIINRSDRLFFNHRLNNIPPHKSRSFHISLELPYFIGGHYSIFLSLNIFILISFSVIKSFLSSPSENPNFTIDKASFYAFCISLVVFLTSIATSHLTYYLKNGSLASIYCRLQNGRNTNTGTIISTKADKAIFFFLYFIINSFLFIFSCFTASFIQVYLSS